MLVHSGRGFLLNRWRMKKRDKLLRRLLSKWKIELLKKPYSKKLSSQIDCIDFLFGEINAD